MCIALLIMHGVPDNFRTTEKPLGSQ